jgi:hypothetical protein
MPLLLKISDAERNALSDACVVLHHHGFELLAQDVVLAMKDDTEPVSKRVSDGLYDAAVELYDIGTVTLGNAVTSLYMQTLDDQLDEEMSEAVERLYEHMTKRPIRHAPVRVDAMCPDCKEPVRYHVN